MKFHPFSWLDALKERLVLTPEEKRVIVFTVMALIVGLAGKYYRSAHPQIPVSIDKQHLAARTQRLSPSPPSPPKKQRRARKESISGKGTASSAWRDGKGDAPSPK